MRRAFGVAMLAAAGILATAGSVSASLAAGAHPARAGTAAATVRSIYWAGYADTAKSGGAKTYKYITTTFTVPAISCSDYSIYRSNENYFLAVLNTDGTNPQTPLGAGVHAYCTSKSSAHYQAVVSYAGFGFGCTSYDGEYFPFSVTPGDTFFASAYYDSADNKFTLKVTDETANRTYQEIEANEYSIAPNAAAVVAFGNTNDPSECGGGGGGFKGTPDFSTVHFGQIKVTDGAQTSAQAMNNPAFNLVQDVQYGPVRHQIDAQPGPLTNTTGPAESSFTDTWRKFN